MFVIDVDNRYIGAASKFSCMMEIFRIGRRVSDVMSCVPALSLQAGSAYFVWRNSQRGIAG